MVFLIIAIIAWVLGLRFIAGVASKIAKILTENNFKIFVTLDSINKRYDAIFKLSRVYLYGKNNLLKWMELIRSSNPKSIEKFNLWQKYRFLHK